MGQHVAFSASSVISPAYLQAIRACPFLSPEEETELAVRWRDHRDKRARAKLLNAHLRLVVKIARKFGRYGMAMDDLIAEGNMGLIRGLDNFNPDLGFRFSTYSQWWIRAQIQDAVMRTASIVRLGTTTEQKRLFFKLRRMKVDLGVYDNGDLAPEIAAKIAEDLDVSVKDVVTMNRRLSGEISLDAPVSDGEDVSSFLDFCMTADPRPDEALLDKERRELFSSLIRDALEVVNPRERDILLRRTLNDEPMTLEELSNEYGVTRERIRQIEQKAAQKIERRIRQRATAIAPATGFTPVENLDAKYRRPARR